jgi:IS5 family transposase
MVGLLLLKQLESLSDERVVLQFKHNPYYQYFCGYSSLLRRLMILMASLASVG